MNDQGARSGFMDDYATALHPWREYLGREATKSVASQISGVTSADAEVLMKAHKSSAASHKENAHAYCLSVPLGLELAGLPAASPSEAPYQPYMSH